MNSLLAVGDSITKEDQVDSILQGLLEEYNPFVMDMYGCPTPHTMCDVKALLYVKDAQLEKFREELVTSNIAANMVHMNHETHSPRGAYSDTKGRRCFHYGRSRGKGRSATGNRPTCQLYGKYPCPSSSGYEYYIAFNMIYTDLWGPFPWPF